MKENVGREEQIIRGILGPTLMALGYTKLGGRKGRTAGLAAIVLGTALTESAITRVCPMNALLGIDTRRKSDPSRRMKSSQVPTGEHAEPLKILKRAEDTKGEFMRAEISLQPSLDAPQANPDLPHRRWIIDRGDKHLHPMQEEHFEVLSGNFRVVIGEDEYNLSEGEEITIPPNTPHQHWNPTDRPGRIRAEIRPAHQAELFFETLYNSAQAGHGSEEGMPDPLQLAVLEEAYPDQAYFATLPINIQKSIFKALAPIGRLLGYRVPKEAKVGIS